jgi:hypothetical protein
MAPFDPVSLGGVTTVKKFLVAAVALTATAFAAMPAAAFTYASGGVTAQEVAAVLRTKNLPVEITTDDAGDPMIKSSSDNLNWRIYFYDCTNGRCTSIQFSSGFDLTNGMTYAKANEWNYTKRFGRAALDDEMDPYVRYDIDVAKGYTSESMTYALATWLLVVPTFSEFIGYN